MIRQLKNVSESTITLTDFQGVRIEPQQIIDGLQFGEIVLRESLDVATQILNGNMVVTEGFQEYQKLRGIDLIRGTASQVTPDGKTIVTTSDRPANTVRYFTSRSDNITTGKIGDGDKLDFDVPAGQTVSKDLRFIDDVYIKDGYVRYIGTSDKCWLSVGVVCPAGIPFPSPGGNTGNYDLTPTGWAPNVSGTGAYLILGVEMMICRFANCLPIPAFGNREEIDAPEPQRLPSAYRLRITCYNGDDATANLKAYFYVGGYRLVTAN